MRDASVMAFADAFMWLAVAAAVAAGLALLVNGKTTQASVEMGAH